MLLKENFRRYLNKIWRNGLVSALEDASTEKSISKILELLDDGEWHSLEEMLRKTGLGRENLKKAVEFLANYNFIVVNEHGGKVRLSDVFLKTLSHKSL